MNRRRHVFEGLMGGAPSAKGSYGAGKHIYAIMGRHLDMDKPMTDMSKDLSDFNSKYRLDYTAGFGDAWNGSAGAEPAEAPSGALQPVNLDF